MFGLGLDKNCGRPHFYEIFLNYRFFTSYRNALFNDQAWKQYTQMLNEKHFKKLDENDDQKNLIMESIKEWNPKQYNELIKLD